jgi:Resolvase, N terminal domain
LRPSGLPFTCVRDGGKGFRHVAECTALIERQNVERSTARASVTKWRLERYGAVGIQSRIEAVARAHPDRPLLLCCFEREREHCHRALAADWIEKHIGWSVPEWQAAPTGRAVELRRQGGRMSGTVQAVVIYGCLSDKGEDEQSIPSQVAKVRERLAQVYPDGFAVVGVFTDDGVSGSKKNRGPGLSAAIDAAASAADEHGQAELWANTSARFARGSGRKDEARSLLELFTQMRRAGVALRAVHDDEMLREELVGINSRMAAKYSEDLVDSVKRAKRRQAERGEHLGGPLPDGYRGEPYLNEQGQQRHRAVIDPSRSEVVRGIFDLARDGVPDAAIARSFKPQPRDDAQRQRLDATGGAGLGDEAVLRGLGHP